ncbi:hypothetical protein [Streptomyces sp. NBC_01216]|uniref:hypothetical protein n=1 Tax=unclassified Streptomyces TaxID=2593676 RepID=UPI002E101202|nr:hypothetical protein OG393_00870 [Streptomyces sp. NBC_01216]
MTPTTKIRRLVAGAASAGLLAGGAALGLSAPASAAPAPASVATVVSHDNDHRHHDRCVWKKGHWDKRWVPGHWEKKVTHHKTWHKGDDKHGHPHKGHWDNDRHYKWVYVPGHWDHHWVKGHWDCHHR